MMNTEVAPVSATVCIGFISIAPACWAVVQFEARTVMSLSSVRLALSATNEAHGWVGSDE
jgi:hypothetical protein